MKQNDHFTLNQFEWLKKAAFSTALIAGLLFFSGCAIFGDLFVPDPETAVVIERDGEKFRITATSKASENAIEKESTAMMKTTSREAGRLMIIGEMTHKLDFFDPSELKVESVTFIKNGKFAVTVATYEK
jgi:hypothetical protein